MFSVIIPVYNKEPHIDRSILSVLGQTYTNFELIIIDDSSTDGSLDKIKKYSDDRLILLQRSEAGPGGYAARNLGIAHAKHEWITFLDADDQWDLIRLEKIFKCIQEFPTASIITNGWFWMENEIKKERDVYKRGFHKLGSHTPFSLADFLLNQDLMWTGAVTIKKNVLEEAGLFPQCPDCKKGGDMDTWIRSLKVSLNNIYIDEPLSYYYRDTVNRVTDPKNNPTSNFCAYNTLLNVYKESNSYKLKNAIKRFINKNLFLLLIKRIQAGHHIDWSLFKKFYFRADMLYYVPRIFWEYCKIRFTR